MNEKQANLISEALGGKVWQSGGDTWLVIFEKADGEIVAVSDDCVCEYASEEKFNSCFPRTSIMFR